MIKIDPIENGTPATLVVELAHVAGALRSHGNERSARVVDEAKDRIERLELGIAAIRYGLSGHQHVDTNSCAFCKIMRECDSAMNTANNKPHRCDDQREEHTSGGIGSP